MITLNRGHRRDDVARVQERLHFLKRDKSYSAWVYLIKTRYHALNDWREFYYSYHRFCKHGEPVHHNRVKRWATITGVAMPDNWFLFNYASPDYRERIGNALLDAALKECPQ